MRDSNGRHLESGDGVDNTLLRLLLWALVLCGLASCGLTSSPEAAAQSTANLVGGSPVAAGQAPWTAVIYVPWYDDVMFAWGQGIFIDPTHILTTSAAVTDLVEAGPHSLKATPTKGVGVQLRPTPALPEVNRADTIAVKNVFLHPGMKWMDGWVKNDLAILELESAAPISSFPVLADGLATFATFAWQLPAHLVSNGPTNLDEYVSPEAFDVEMRLISRHECKKIIAAESTGIEVEEIGKDVICAAPVTAADVCAFDGGAPLYTTLGNRSLLLGLALNASSNAACSPKGSRAFTFTEIAPFRKYIQGCQEGSCPTISEMALGCEHGWGDCDGDPANGCEMSVMGVEGHDHCGSCGTPACDVTEACVDVVPDNNTLPMSNDSLRCATAQPILTEVECYFDDLSGTYGPPGRYVQFATKSSNEGNVYVSPSDVQTSPNLTWMSVSGEKRLVYLPGHRSNIGHAYVAADGPIRWSLTFAGVTNTATLEASTPVCPESPFKAPASHLIP